MPFNSGIRAISYNYRGSFPSKCVSTLFLLHQMYLKIVLCLYFMTFPSSVLLLNERKTVNKGKGDQAISCFRILWTCESFLYCDFLF
jgi:hypothetical protein